MNLEENISRIKTLIGLEGRNNIKIISEVDEKCKKTTYTEFEEAKKFMKRWLSSDFTKEKFKKNWKSVNSSWTDEKINSIFNQYISHLDKIQLVFFDNKMSKIEGIQLSQDQKSKKVAFVRKDIPNKIFCNCSILMLPEHQKEILTTLVHEITHSLEKIHPLNPPSEVNYVFANPEHILNFDPKEKQDNTIVVNKKLPTEKKDYTSSEVNRVMKDLNINRNSAINVIEYWKKLLFQSTDEYTCDSAEKMSNIMAMRKKLSISPGQRITKEDLIPYIFTDKIDMDFSFFIMCWTLKKFPPLDEVINKTNELAINYNQKIDSDTDFA